MWREIAEAGYAVRAYVEGVEVLCVDCSAAGEGVVGCWGGGVCILPPRARWSMGDAALCWRDRGGCGGFGRCDGVDFILRLVGKGIVNFGNLGVAEGTGTALLQPAG